MKRNTLKNIVLSLVVIGLAAGPAVPSYAAVSVSKAKSDYSKALKTETSAKADYDKANTVFKTGSFGFYQWIIDNCDGWKRADAQEALQVLTTSSHKNYTEKGNKDDATSLDNMRAAVDLLPTLASKRAGDKNYPDLQPPTIRNVYMARAQIQANVSSYTMGHEVKDDGCKIGSACENLAWGYRDPFVGWYDEELKNYNNVRNYTLKKYGKDINTDEWECYLRGDDFDYHAYLKETDKYGEIGHYTNVCMSGVLVHDFTYEPTRIYSVRADKVFFGMAYSGYSRCHSLEADNNAFNEDYSDGYSVSEYRSLFNQYYNKVYPKAQIESYNKAKKNASSALKTLKNAAKPRKPAARRTGKKIKVSWKKVKGVSGYQISVSPSKGKVKIAASAGAKATKKTVKIRKARKQYVRIRSYVKVNGKKIYSSWSPARRSN